MLVGAIQCLTYLSCPQPVSQSATQFDVQLSPLTVLLLVQIAHTVIQMTALPLSLSVVVAQATMLAGKSKTVQELQGCLAYLAIGVVGMYILQWKASMWRASAEHHQQIAKQQTQASSSLYLPPTYHYSHAAFTVTIPLECFSALAFCSQCGICVNE